MLLTVFIDTMKDLMIKTLKKLKVARTRYHSALFAFDDLKYKLQRSDTDRLFGRTTILNRDIDDAVFVIYREIEQIGRWKQEARNVNANIAKYPTETLKLFESFRTIFKMELVYLKIALKIILIKPSNIKS